MIKVRHHGNFKNIEKLLTLHPKKKYKSLLNKYGEQGVKALMMYTPVDTGTTSNSWNYRIIDNSGSVSLQWYNTNVNRGVNIAVILQYGHFTRNGGYVEGVDYINPALKPIFDKLADEAWKEVIE